MRQSKLGEKPEHTWREAVVRWLKESAHKRSLKNDKCQLKWVNSYLSNKKLSEIDNFMIEEIAKKKQASGVTRAMINRLLALLRSILRKAELKWKWIDKTPSIELRHEGEKRERWLTQEEIQRLLKELPLHLPELVIFSLATGLRQANVLGLRWKDVNLEKRHAMVHANQSKTKTSIPVPLNSDAVSVIRRQLGKHLEFVFTYKGIRLGSVIQKLGIKP